MTAMTLDAYRAMVGREIGVSRWFGMDQARIDRFADVTEDRQFIHIDPERAKETAFGGTVAHGFLTLSLLPAMSFDAQPDLIDRVLAVNYGFDRVRLIAPVPAGSRVRGRFVLQEITDRGPGEIMTRTEATVEIGGAEKPALIADWLALSRFA